ncbi:FtsK/SpoIIIE domain-containing protein [Calidifontibacter terrae]
MSTIPDPEFAITVVDDRGLRHDHVVSPAAGSTWGDLRSALCLTGDWHVGTRRLESADPLRRLPHGSLLLPHPLATGIELLHLTCIEGPAVGARLRLTDRMRIIGRGPLLDLTLPDPDLSRRQCGVRVVAGRVQVRDLGSTNGTWIGSRRLDPTVEEDLRAGDRLRLGNCVFRLDQRYQPPPMTENFVAVQRHPYHAREPQLIVLRPPTPPTGADRRPIPWLVTLLPLIVALMLAWWLHNAMFLAFAVFSPVMMLAQYLSDQRSGRQSAAAGRASYALAVRHHQQVVTNHLREELAARRAIAAPLTQAADAVEFRSAALWHRHPEEFGYLQWRIGTGIMPSGVRARAADEVNDPLESLPCCPVTVDLARHRLVGVQGSAATRPATIDSLLVQLMAWHSPVVVEIALVGAQPIGRHPQLAWVPHLRPDVRSPPRVVDCSDDESVSSLLAHLGEATEQDRPPRTVVVVTDPDAFRASALAGLLASPARYAATVVCFVETDTTLPARSRPVVRLDSALSGHCEQIHFVPDLPTADLVRRTIRGVVPLIDAAPGNGAESPPPNVDLESVWRADHGDDLLSTADTVARWTACPHSTRVLLGSGGGGPFAADLRLDGPHALVAGTTGAGKSELLQTLVAALAAANRPDELSFVLIDYKGGAAFAECARLPHTVGVVTDLDTHLTERALDSLSAELRRREHLLAAVGAKDLDDYRSVAGRARVPRLVLVIDEFRVLAEELPDFIAGLVRLATVGRSLGVHLLLATQRPAGVVTADIRANVNLRIALRVRDDGDSHDVVEAADAARIRATTPGRAYVRSGSGDLVTFQTARVSVAPAAEKQLTVTSAARPGLTARPTSSPGSTVLGELIRVLDAAADHLDIATGAPPWLPPLPTTIGSEPVESATDEAVSITGLAVTPFAVLGRQDRPAEQTQPLLAWQPDEDQHLAIIGGPRSGRSTALRRLLRDACGRRTPAELQVHLLDLGRALSDLEDWPHLGSRIESDEPSRLARLMDHLTSEVSLRQQRQGVDPMLVLAIDGWEVLVETAEDLLFGRVMDQLTAVLRDGPSVGIQVVTTGGRGLLTSRSLPLFRSQLVLRMTDVDDIAAAGIPRRCVPTELPPGRALIAPSGVECQFALPATDAPEGDATGVTRIDALPEQVRLTDLPASRDLRVGQGTSQLLGLPYGGRGDLVALVAGPPGSGRSGMLHTAANGLVDRPIAWVSGSAGSNPPAGAVRMTAADQLSAWLADHPAGAVLVDDAETVFGTDIEDVLATHATRAVHTGGVLLLASSALDLNGNYRELVAELRRRQTGVFLTPTQAEGEFLGLRFPRLDRPRPGAGFICLRGQLSEVQVALA